MSPRLRATIRQCLLTAGVFFVVRLLILQLPGRGPEPVTETLLVAAVLGLLVGAWTWWRWPGGQRNIDPPEDAGY